MQVSPSNAPKIFTNSKPAGNLAMDALEAIAEVQQKGIEGLWLRRLQRVSAPGAMCGVAPVPAWS
jgi:hypothetical protein